MDLYSEIKTKYNLEDEILENGNGKEKKPKPKLFSAEEIQEMVVPLQEMLDTAEDAVIERGFSPEALIQALTVMRNTINDKMEEMIPGSSGATIAASEARQALNPELQEEQDEEEENEKDSAEEFYDFEKFPPLQCKFLGEGPEVTAQGRAMKTWQVEELNEEKTKWFLPQWKIFSEVQGNFLGFQSEEPEKYIYQLTYKGKQTFEGGAFKYMVEVLKKFAAGNGKQ